MKRTKPLLSNLVLVVKPQFAGMWTHGFTLGANNRIRTLQQEITTEWNLFP